MTSPEWLVADWPAPARVRAFTTLRGGEDLRALTRVAPMPATPVWLHQVHGSDVSDLDSHAPLSTADAAITGATGRICVVRTADCLPVLFAAADGSAVGAAHAGWRGLAGGVLDATVARLRERAHPGVELLAWLGPAISAANYEVGDDVRSAFLQRDSGAESGFQPNARGRWQCDLYALARRALAQAGVTRVYGGGFCAFADAARFHSHRRDGHLPGGAGRMASMIWLT